MTEQQMRDFVARLHEKFYPGVDMPTVEFNARLRTTAGRAWARKIEINKNLGTMVGLEGMKQTLAHEFAHCVQRQQDEKRGFNSSPHGIEWRSIMTFMGFEPNRTHKLFDEHKIERPKGQRRWRYTCPCKTKHEIATITHNRIQRGTHSYQCKHCLETIEFTGEEV